VTLSDALQLLAGLVLVGVGIAYYRRRAREEKDYGSQGAVIMIVFGLIALVLGFDLLEYRPWPAELIG
jgi:cytochrome c oxidase assembly factor CtaG